VADVLVLCYHAVSERWPASLSVTPEALREQVGLLVRRGYRGVGFTEAVLSPPAGRTLAVTFDDAFHSVLERARPILDELGVTATLFVPTDFPEHPDVPMRWPGIEQWLGSEHEAELRPMSWDEVRVLADAGWEIGSHTKSHPRLSSLPDAEMERELEDSRLILEERLGRPCNALAYPFGDHDERVVEAAGRAGYAVAGTLPVRLDRPVPLRWPRTGVYHFDDLRRFRLKASRIMRLARATPFWPQRDDPEGVGH
jgi:peptidoglycan/xylan/chitin deacetylase (PgdA/CDA1 family)